MDFLLNLRCPITKNGLVLINKNEFSNYSIPDNYENINKLTKGLIDKTNQYFYPIFDDIIVLHEHYALFIGEGKDERNSLSFDKKRVFDYYNEVNYKIKDSLKIYEDSPHTTTGIYQFTSLRFMSSLQSVFSLRYMSVTKHSENAKAYTRRP